MGRFVCVTSGWILMPFSTCLIRSLSVAFFPGPTLGTSQKVHPIEQPYCVEIVITHFFSKGSSSPWGTPFISFKQAALPETCRDSGSKLLPLKDGQVDKKLFVKTIKDILSDKSKWDNLHQKALKKNQSWGSAAVQWDQLFKDILAETGRLLEILSWFFYSLKCYSCLLTRTENENEESKYSLILYGMTIAV